LNQSPRITGWGKYLPHKVLTNQDLEKLIDTSDEWITSRTGIKERRIASDEETASSLGVQAARKALEVAGLPASQLDLIIVATSTAERIFPACASVIQDQLGAKRAGAFDVNAACSGFIYSLATAYHFVLGGLYRNIIVVGSEVYSRIIDWHDRSTCVLFGDGAGAVLVQGMEGERPLVGFSLGSDGSKGEVLYAPGICGPIGNGAKSGHFLVMEGKEVFKAAANIMVASSRQALTQVGWTTGDVDLFIPHQANKRIIDMASKQLGVPQERVYLNLHRYGNTSSASIPIAVCEAVEEERLKPGDKLVMVGFGAGFSWGAMALEWQPYL